MAFPMRASDGGFARLADRKDGIVLHCQQLTFENPVFFS
jgi:hypothetical protein